MILARPFTQLFNYYNTFELVQQMKEKYDYLTKYSDSRLVNQIL